MTTPLPAGFRLMLDPSVKTLADGLLFGGSPARVLRLTKAGRAAWERLADHPVATPAEGTLARLLTDAGFAHPVPPAPAEPADATVVIPVLDRAELLDRCLGGLDSLGGRYPVLVVDDGSADPAAIAAIASAHGAKLVRRDVNGGPGAARNTALDHVSTSLIAFLDSDCVPSPDWIDRLAGHFADPLVAAVAPRIRPLAPGTWAGRYSRAASSLDMGTAPARVAPGTRLSYVPTAALLVRRSAMASVAFDPEMRVGEDVDFGWRLHDAGFRLRYEPSAQVDHHEPAGWPAVLRRRASYGTSAAPLALRRPDAMAPLVLHPWPTLTAAALLARRPLLASAGFAGAVLSMTRALRRGDVPTNGVVPAMATAVGQTWLGFGRYGTQFAAPLLAALLLPGGRRRWGRRAAIASLLAGPPLTAWAKNRPGLDPFRYTAGAIADDLAYGAGVWAGCLNHRTAVPLRPRITWRPLRVDRKGKQ
ncbi:mycofactocin biosynthesis glycosyltransferase MftF [Amycolatopsis benzoatilytica]|uniref:mycofactocin biosynthesis glycosyltransferase MftF n=1 Tax=Amycolatopsis benzoatilytica TaxID=346045 RepID=UPI00036AE7A2|nr:mycofactocin biosynthesis glycosyltransferase MftF [Amycolatopsis benzoatilytica]